jgi:HlyD family secretion protein
MSTVETAIPSTVPRKHDSLPDLVRREQRRHKRRSLLWTAGLIALPILVAAGFVLLRPGPVPFEERFRTGMVTTGDVVREVRATGHLEAVSTVQVGAEISGRIASVEADYNDHVTAGKILARFDRTSLQAQVDQTGATLAAARAALEQARVDRDQAKQNLVRAKDLFAKQAASEADRDAAVNASRSAEAREHAAEAQVEAQEAAHTLAQTSLSHTVVRSPIDGIVISRHVDPGQTVAAALQSPVLFEVAADLRKMQVVTAVDEADIGEVAPDQRALFTVNAWTERTFEGTVTEVRNSPQVVQDVVTYGTVVDVDNPDLALKPGMTASVRIRTAAVKNAVRIPDAALRFTPPAAGRGSKTEVAEPGRGVWVIEGGALRRVPVKTGVSDGETTAITGPSLSPGTKVVLDLTPAGKKAYGLATAK